MDSTSILIQTIILVILLIGSGFFSASETSLMSLSKIRIRHMQEEGVKGAKLVASLIEDSNKLLSTILVGNNVVNIAATSISTSLFITLLGPQGVPVATAIMTVLVLLFGEITPKTIAANNSEKVAILVSRPIKIIIFILRPVVWVFNLVTGVIFKILGVKDKSGQPYITEEELKTMVNVSHEEGVLEIEERQIINNVFQFGDMQAKEAMVQRLDMIAINSEDKYEEIIEMFKNEKLSRMPVYNESIDDIIGILNIKDIIFLNDEEIQKFNIKDYIREPFFTYEFKKITQLLEEMKIEKSQMAIVVDEYGGTYGLVTMEDIIEELVGEIYDEHDAVALQDIVQQQDGSYRVLCSTNIDKMFDYFDIDEEVDATTVNGWVILQIDKLPEVGDSFVYIADNKEFDVAVTKADERKALEINMTVSDVPEEE